jgi:hypothetical protein
MFLAERLIKVAYKAGVSPKYDCCLVGSRVESCASNCCRTLVLTHVVGQYIGGLHLVCRPQLGRFRMPVLILLCTCRNGRLLVDCVETGGAGVAVLAAASRISRRDSWLPTNTSTHLRRSQND